MNYNNAATSARPIISPDYDPWDPIRSLHRYGQHVLTSVEFTITNMCNMRCEHCAVGDTLARNDPVLLPVSSVLKKLDGVEHLETISITGGEPSFREATMREYIIPLLQYAKDRGVRTQLNSNLTLDYTRYEPLLPYLDVMHISFNYTGADDFHKVGFARSERSVPRQTAVRLYEQMIDNSVRLSEAGMFVSAESMINYRTHLKLGQIHQLIDQMGCRRHEVHPMYPSAFAASLPTLTLEQTRDAVNRLLDERNPSLWMLFGTLPFFWCNSDSDDQRLLSRLRHEPNVTVRNDPDGKNRLNVNLFTGNVYVTDFSDVPHFGNILEDELDRIFADWLEHPLYHRVNCFCPEASCCGPNLLVADAYYRNVDFHTRKALV